MNNSWTIQLFGGLRPYGNEGLLNIAAVPGDTVKDIKARVIETLTQTIPSFDGQELIEQSVLADEARIFSMDECMKPLALLSMLPPVCGG